MGEHSPRRLLRDGAQSLSDAELVSVLLNSSCRGTSAQGLTEDFLRDLGGLAGLESADARLLDLEGVGTVRAAILLAARELAACFGRARILGREVLDQPAAIANYVTLRFGSADQEVLAACSSTPRIAYSPTGSFFAALYRGFPSSPARFCTRRRMKRSGTSWNL